MQDNVIKEMLITAELLKRFASEKSAVIVKAAGVIADRLKFENTVFFAGNGGSASQAQHAAAELVGRFVKERRGYRALALNTDTSILTAVANDYGYNRIFERQIEALARDGDVFVALSTSGNSPNIIKALELARSMKVITVGITGPGGGKIKNLSDFLIDVPEGPTYRIQELHLVTIHILCGEIERILTEGGAP